MVGADGGCEDGDEAVERERLAALLLFERVGHDGLRHGLQAASADALYDRQMSRMGSVGAMPQAKLETVKMTMQSMKKLRRPMTEEAQPPQGRMMAFETR